MGRRLALSEDQEVKETLKKMAQFSISNNQINEIQQHNLKAYPFVFFNGVKSVKIDYDLTNHNKVEYDTNPKTLEIVYRFGKPSTENFRISYDIEIDESEYNPHMEKRFAALEKSICTLFWRGIPVEVSFNGKNVYKSKKDVRE